MRGQLRVGWMVALELDEFAGAENRIAVLAAQVTF